MKVSTHRTVGLALACFLVTAEPAHAQNAAPAEQSDPIIVPGEREAETLETEVLRFVRSYGRYSRIDQLARWRDPMCVRVSNLEPAYNAFIADRIKTIASQAGAPVSDDDACTPNVQIIFTTQPQALIDQIAADRPALLGYHFISARRTLTTVRRPIQAWYVTATRNGIETYIDDARRNPPNGAAGSRLTHQLESLFVNVLILVDQAEIAGAEVGPLSDYLAMLSLTEMRDQDGSCGALASIMELFSEGCPSPQAPQSVTASDTAFLRGLYAMSADAIGPLQRAQIRTRMNRELREPESD